MRPLHLLLVVPFFLATTCARPGAATPAGSVPAPAPATTPFWALPAPELGPQTPEVAWTFRTGDFLRHPVAVGADVLVLASDDNHLYALDPVEGSPRWTAEARDNLGAPALLGEWVFAGDWTGRLRAMPAATGEILWETDLEGWLEAPPLQAGQSLLVASLQGWLYALEPGGGRQRWARSVGDLAGAPQLAAGLWIVPLRRGELVALEPATGDARWSWAFDEPLRSGPVVVGELILQGTVAGHLVALEAGTGRPRWGFASPAAIEGRPAGDGQRVYVADAGGWVSAVEASTGGLLWQRHLVGQPVRSDLGLHGDTLVLGTDGGRVVGLGVGGGELRWSFPTARPLVAGAATAGGLLLVPSLDRTLYALKLP